MRKLILMCALLAACSSDRPRSLDDGLADAAKVWSEKLQKDEALLRECSELYDVIRTAEDEFRLCGENVIDIREASNRAYLRAIKLKFTHAATVKMAKIYAEIMRIVNQSATFQSAGSGSINTPIRDGISQNAKMAKDVAEWCKIPESSSRVAR